MPDRPDALFLDFQSAVAGRYSLEQELGRGGMGVVYLARDVRLDRPVAVKLLPPQFAAQTDLRERFLREARTSAKLSHPHIVPIHAVDEAGHFVFFVMAYVEGDTLAQRVRTRGPVPPHEAARILREVAWALAYAHAQGVVHRDVKPDNIMLEMATGRAMVTDFGIARLAQAKGITGRGEVVGTPEFMSPEQACGDEVDGRSDLYSLGVVGFYALSGHLPFQAESVPVLLGQHLTQPPPALVAPGAPRRLVQAIERCLAKEPGARFASGEALAEVITQSEETRKELPVPVRVFLRKSHNLERGVGGYLIGSVLFLPGFFATLREGEPVGSLILGALIAAFSVLPTTLYMRQVRRLIRQGYGREDVLLGLQTEVDRGREEVAFEYGLEPSRLERWLSRIAYAGLGVALAGFAVGAALSIGPGAFPGWLAELFGISLGVGVVTGIPAGILSQRRLVPGARRLKYWKSWLGRLVFKLAGIGVHGPALPHATHRPTELAIGLAADALYAALPKETRRALPDLAEVLKRLQDDAQRMRKRVEELSQMVADAERGGALAHGLAAERRGALVADLRKARDAAQERLGQAVAALETIRLDLLRLSGGVGSVASLTADLDAAREVGEQVERLLAGAREVEEALERH